MSSLSKNTGAFSSDIRYLMKPSFDKVSGRIKKRLSDQEIFIGSPGLLTVGPMLIGLLISVDNFHGTFLIVQRIQNFI